MKKLRVAMACEEWAKARELLDQLDKEWQLSFGHHAPVAEWTELSRFVNMMLGISNGNR